MSERYSPISKNINSILHGADYNPDQWMETPEIWNEDMRLMKLSNINSVTLGIFSWSSIEPEEGKFSFDWLDKIMDMLAENGISVILTTPSGARPAWLSEKYPEVLRVGANRVRNLHGQRHNHCYTSPIYREKVGIINTKLAERYCNHPALAMWHISNEYGGECHCPYCQNAFREWLKKRYDNEIDKINRAWWTGFWSHKFNNWSQIESPAPHGECYVHGQNLDWKRFVTDQTIDFYRSEIKPLREITPDIPITTNFMGGGGYETCGFYLYEGLDYSKFAKEVDVVSYDSYPFWHSDNMKTWELAAHVSFVYDVNRSFKKGQPFMLIESTPSLVNWQKVNKIKRPGMNKLSSLQAVAHGSDSIIYFQWRKSRGASEKLHGAVVDHCGHENTRVFKEVSDLSIDLKKIAEVIGTSVRPEIAIIFDWQNSWAIKDLQGLRLDKKDYEITCIEHYKSFWKQGVPVDVIDMEADFSGYKLLIAPMLYMIRPGVAEKIENFVANGGTLVTTYWSGIVDESDLCFLGGFPGPLRNVTGVWAEEIDSLYDIDSNSVVFKENNFLEIEGEYEAKWFCEVIHADTAEVLATYKHDYYRDTPAVTVNKFGKGSAYYIASRNDSAFNDVLYCKLVDKLSIRKVLDSKLPEGVTVQLRSDGENNYIFVMNFCEEEKRLNIKKGTYVDMIAEKDIYGEVILEPYEVKVLKSSIM
jgi:beta-galactosidase